MIDTLVALESLDKFLGNVWINPDEKDVAMLVFFSVEFKIEILMD